MARGRKRQPPHTIEVLEADEEIDARAWARQYVRAILRAEGYDVPSSEPAIRGSVDSSVPADESRA